MRANETELLFVGRWGEICLGEAHFADLATSIARYSGVLSVMQAAPFDDVPRSAAGRQ